jgi:hypothetical protein
MNSLIGRSRLVAAALCGVFLAGCNSIEDVQQPSYTPPPTLTAVLEGKITGLGTRRPLVLRYNSSASERSFFGVMDQSTSAFSFGSLPVGTSYNITVLRQPFGKNCTVANGAGTVSTAPGADILVTCANDSTPRFCVGGTISQVVHDTPGAKLILTTEEGTQTVAAATLPVSGTSACWFPNSIFNSLTSVPVFVYNVTANFADANGTVNNCAVTNPTNPIVGTGSEAGPVAPTANVTNVAVTACTFPVGVNVAYNGTPTQTLAAPITLELRDPRTGTRVVQKDPVTGLNVQVPAITASSFSTVTFTGILSNANAMYDLVVTTQPTVGGVQVQTCVVGLNTPTAQLTAGSGVLLIDPADPTNGFVPAASTTNPASGISKNVRCRANPVAANQLRGTYQQTSIVTATSGTPPVTTVTTTKNRNFLTFFEDGTFLYGVHGLGVSTGPPSGVEHGFYAYSAGTITFTALTDTITGTNTNRLAAAGAAGTLTSVVKLGTSPSRITARLNTTTTWQLDEPKSLLSEMTGAWASADHRQVWVYEANGYTGMYIGVNGLGTAADSCWPIDPPNALSGYFSRRGNATTCELGDGLPAVTNLYTLTIPNATTVPRLPEGYVGRWPEAQSNADGRPSSPASFLIDLGTLDKLTVQDTLNGVPVYVPFVFYRIKAN